MAKNENMDNKQDNAVTREEYESLLAELSELKKQTNSKATDTNDMSAVRKERLLESEKLMNEKVRVRLHKDEGRYKDDVFVSVNGNSIRIKRGEWVEIPKAHAMVLDNSVEQMNLTADLIEKESQNANW